MWEQRRTWILFLVGIMRCFDETRSQTDSNSRYYLDVTLVNHYGKAVSIITANTNTTRTRFVIPVGGSYQIRSTHLTTQRLYITAHDAQSFFPITINGKQSITITARDTPVSLVYFIPLAPILTESPHYSNIFVSTKSTIANYSTNESPTHPAVPTETPSVSTNGTADTNTKTEVPTETILATKGPIDFAVSPTPTDTVVLTKDTTKRSTDALVSTTGPTNNRSENITNAGVATEGPTDGALSPTPNDFVVLKKDPTKRSTEGRSYGTVITEAPTHDSNVVVNSIESGVLTKDPNENGPTNSPTGTGAGVAADADAEDNDKKYKTYIVSIIVLAIFVTVLFVIVACLVYRVLLKTKDKTKNGIIYEDEELSENDTAL